MGKRKTKMGPDPIDKFVGARVRARRVGIGMSQTKLGQAIGVTFQQVQKYENGSNRIGAGNLLKIGRILGVEIGYFFQDVPESLIEEPTNSGGRGLYDHPVPAFDRDPLASREAVELTNAYFGIHDDDVRKRIFHLIRSLADNDC